jgi:nucleolar protein 58
MGWHANFFIFWGFHAQMLMLQEISCLNNAAVSELMRGLGSQLSELIVGLRGSDIAPMSLGLSHSLSHYKLKFSPDKIIL